MEMCKRIKRGIRNVSINKPEKPYLCVKLETMEITINFDANNSKAVSLLKFLKSLDFITIKSNDYELNSFEKKWLDEGIKDIENDNYTSHENVVMEAKQKYPNLFE